MRGSDALMTNSLMPAVATLVLVIDSAGLGRFVVVGYYK